MKEPGRSCICGAMFDFGGKCCHKTAEVVQDQEEVGI